MNNEIFTRKNFLDYLWKYQRALIVALMFLTPVIAWTHGVGKAIHLSLMVALIWQPLALHAWWSDKRNIHHVKNVSMSRCEVDEADPEK
jgi:hypothetical protein